METKAMKRGRGKAAKNKTPQEAYGGGAVPKRSKAEMKKSGPKRESAAERLTRHNIL